MPFIRSTRSVQRRKMVLPVTVLRHDGQESLLAHTLDVTEVSARLGGLGALLEPGEVILIQRGSLKARFEVFWMGTRGSAMEGQAGVRSLELSKVDWGIQLPSDEADVDKTQSLIRRSLASRRGLERRPIDKRWNTRFECTGRGTVRDVCTSAAMRGQVKDISRGGVYMETATPLPVNTEVYVKMEVEGTAVEGPGVVRTSYSHVGMGVSFQRFSQENSDKIADIIMALRQKAHLPKEAAVVRKPKGTETVSVEMITKTCRSLAQTFEQWKATRSADEIGDLSRALSQLQEKLLRAASLSSAHGRRQ